MHIPTPEELRAKREKLNLKQSDVARMAGISQSMVARIEAGSVDPRMSTLSKIINVLNMAEGSTITASDIMKYPVFSVNPDDILARAVEILELNKISQLPVIKDRVPVGCISESALINAMEESGTQKSRKRLVREFMEPGFPTVPPNTAVEMIGHILQNNHAVLVLEKGEVIGVITKHDLIHQLL